MTEGSLEIWWTRDEVVPNSSERYRLIFNPYGDRFGGAGKPYDIGGSEKLGKYLQSIGLISEDILSRIGEGGQHLVLEHALLDDEHLLPFLG